jgi:hypothetical protein
VFGEAVTQCVCILPDRKITLSWPRGVRSSDAAPRAGRGEGAVPLARCWWPADGARMPHGDDTRAYCTYSELDGYTLYRGDRPRSLVEAATRPWSG